MTRLSIVFVLLLAGCSSGNFDPASYVTGMRLLTVLAEPPEIPAGAQSALSAVAVDIAGADGGSPDGGTAINYHWSACLAPRSAASGVVDDACVTDPSVLTAVGDGANVMLTMPTLDPSMLGLPDASFGFYLPVRLDLSAGDSKDVAFYRLRYSLGLLAPNQNPVITGVEGVAVQNPKADLSKQPSPEPFAESTPIEVGVNEGVRLRVDLADGSAESYLIPVGDPTKGQTQTITEELREVWFATAGSFTEEVTGQAKPDTIFRLDSHVPSSGQLIDVWVVVSDERGGQSIAHRSLLSR